MELLPERLAWYIGGPIIGLLVVALYAVANKHLGVTTSYLQVGFRDNPAKLSGGKHLFQERYGYSTVSIRSESVSYHFQ